MRKSRLKSGVDTEVSPITPTRRFLVGNIHVLFNPKRGDIKLGQVRLFLEKAHRLSQEWGSIPVIIAGDLNSMPQSALYQFLASSEFSVRLHKPLFGVCCSWTSYYMTEKKYLAKLIFLCSAKPCLQISTQPGP